MFRYREFVEQTGGGLHIHGIYLQISRALHLYAACFITAALMSGCGGDRGPERVVVSGTITYNGKPISRGLIRFVPDAKSSVPSAAAEIVDGQYRAASYGGVAVGTHKIEIDAYRQAPEKPGVPIEFSRRARQQYLPTKYNRDSQEKITIESGSGKITRDFQLTD